MIRVRFSFVLLFFASFFVGGCGSVYEQEMLLESPAQPKPSTQQVYENSRFQYQFSIPDGSIVYALNLADQTAHEAQNQDEVVFVTGEETNVLTIRGLETEQSAHEWLTQHLSFFYPTGEVAQTIGEIDGQRALFFLGEGAPDSPHRLIVVEQDHQLMIITIEQEAVLFEKILASLRFRL